MVVASGNDKRMIASHDLAELDFRRCSDRPPRITGFKGEQLFTSAILQLSEGRKPKILFTTGHGERALDDQGGQGLSGAQSLLGRDNFELSEWASLGQAAVPPGTDLLVIAGPKGSFVQPELDALSAYLNDGGRMLVMLDPTLDPAGAGLVEHRSRGVARPLRDQGGAGHRGRSRGDPAVLRPGDDLPQELRRPSGHQGVRGGERAGAGEPRPLGPRRQRAGDQGHRPDAHLGQGVGETDLAHLPAVSRDPRDVAGPVPVGRWPRAR